MEVERGATSRWLVSIAVMMALLVVPSSAAQSEPYTAYGATAGDPRVFEDGAACFDAARDRNGTSCAVVYGHVFDQQNLLPMNQQRPPDALLDGTYPGYFAPGTEQTWDFNDVTFWLVAGFVQYQDDGDGPSYPAPGLAANLTLDSEVPIHGYVTLSGDMDEMSGMALDPAVDVGVLPCLTVRMTLQGMFPWESPRRIAEGSVTKTIVSQAGATGQPDPLVADAPCPGGEPGDVIHPEDATEIEIALAYMNAKDTVSADEGLTFVVEWYSYAPGDPGEPDKIYPHWFDLRSGPEHVPRVVVPLRDAIAVDEFTVIPYEDRLFLSANVTTPWGPLNIDPSSVSVEILGADGAPVALQHVAPPRLLGFFPEEFHYRGPVNAVVEWDAVSEDLAPGAYVIRATAMNWQHTATATRDLGFDVAKDGSLVLPDGTIFPKPAAAQAPLAGVTLLLAALGLLLGAARFRRS